MPKCPECNLYIFSPIEVAILRSIKNGNKVKKYGTICPECKKTIRLDDLFGTATLNPEEHHKMVYKPKHNIIKADTAASIVDRDVALPEDDEIETTMLEPPEKAIMPKPKGRIARFITGLGIPKRRIL